MTVYSPTGKNTGAAVVVFPGGGYEELAIDLEGTEVCDWLTAKGITCVLLKYRVPAPRSDPYWGAYPQSPMALEDAQRTVGLVRFHAAEWHIDPHKIGVLGIFGGRASGGGDEHAFRHVCIRLSMRPTKKAAARILRWRFIRGICRLARRSWNGRESESGYSRVTSPVRRRLRFCCRTRMTMWTT